VNCIDEHDLGAGEVDLFATLGCVAPVDIDVGFGKGRSLLEWSARGFEGTLLGVEVRRSFVEVACSRAARMQACGIRIVRGDFRSLAPRLRPDRAVRRFFLHFPDPWWKKRHLKRQVVSPAVVAAIARLLEPGGEVFVQTDVPERAEEFRAAFRGAGLEDAPPGGRALETNPFGVRSNREARCEAAGVPVYRMLFRRPRP
jgi:tRNA (guanine-N7-)-methyltransferase